MKDYAKFGVGDTVHVRPTGATGRIYGRINGPVSRYWITGHIQTYTDSQIVHIDDPDQAKEAAR